MHILITTVDGASQHGRDLAAFSPLWIKVFPAFNYVLSTHTVSCTVNIMTCTAGVGDDLHS